MDYAVMSFVWSECGDVYRVRRIEAVFKDPNDPRKQILERDGQIKSHGYCPDCHSRIMAELKLLKRKKVNVYA